MKLRDTRAALTDRDRRQRGFISTLIRIYYIGAETVSNLF